MRPVAVFGLVIDVEGDWFLGRKGSWWMIGLVDIVGSLSYRFVLVGLLYGESESSSESNAGDGGSRMSFGDSSGLPVPLASAESDIAVDGTSVDGIVSWKPVFVLPSLFTCLVRRFLGQTWNT